MPKLREKVLLTVGVAEQGENVDSTKLHGYVEGCVAL